MLLQKLISSDHAEIHNIIVPTEVLSVIPTRDTVDKRSEIDKCAYGAEKLQQAVIEAPLAHVIVCSAELRLKIFSAGEVNNKRLTDNSFKVLEAIAVSKEKGVTQAELKNLFDMDSRTVFYHTKLLVQKDIAIKRPVSQNGAYTQLIVLKRFANGRPDGAEGDDEEVSDKRSIELMVSKLTKVLDSVENRTICYDDMKKAPELAVYSWDVLKKVIGKLEEHGILERFYVKNGKKDVRCARLLVDPANVKGYKVENKENVEPAPDMVAETEAFTVDCSQIIKEHFEEKVGPETSSSSNQQIEHVEPPIPKGPPAGITNMRDMPLFIGHLLRSDITLDAQIFYLVAYSGKDGITSTEIFLLLGGTSFKMINKLLSDMEALKGANKIRRVKEFYGKEQRYRYFLAQPAKWSGIYGKGISLPGSAPDKASDEEVSLVDNSVATILGAKPANLSVLTVAQRRENLLEMLEEQKIIEYTARFMSDFEEKYEKDSGVTLDRKSMQRLATNIQREKLLKMVVVESRSITGSTDTRTLFLHPSIDAKGPEMKAFVEKLNEDMISKSIQKVSKEYKDIEVERLYDNEEEAEKSSNYPNYFAVAEAKGYVRAKLSRARIFHRYLFSMYTSLIEDEDLESDMTVDSSKVFRELPLQVFLKVVGVFRENPALDEFITGGGDLSLPVCKVPYQIAKAIFGKAGISRYKRALRTVFDVLAELKLIEIVESQQADTDMSFLPKEYLLKRQVPFPFFDNDTGEILYKPQDLYNVNDAVIFWNELEQSSLLRKKYLIKEKAKLAKKEKNKSKKSKSGVTEDAMEVDENSAMFGQPVNDLPTPMLTPLGSPYIGTALSSDILVEQSNWDFLARIPQERLDKILTTADEQPDGDSTKSSLEDPYESEIAARLARTLQSSVSKLSAPPKKNLKVKPARKVQTRIRQKNIWTVEMDRTLNACFIAGRAIVDTWPHPILPWARISEKYFPGLASNALRQRINTIARNEDVKNELEAKVGSWKSRREELVNEGKLDKVPPRLKEFSSYDLDKDLSFINEIEKTGWGIEPRHCLPVVQSDVQDLAAYLEENEFVTETDISISEPYIDLESKDSIQEKLGNFLQSDHSLARDENDKLDSREEDYVTGSLKSMFLNMDPSYDSNRAIEQLSKFDQRVLEQKVDELVQNRFLLNVRNTHKQLGHNGPSYSANQQALQLITGFEDLFVQLTKFNKFWLEFSGTYDLSDENLGDVSFLSLVSMLIQGFVSFTVVTKDVGDVMKSTRNVTEAPVYSVVFSPKQTNRLTKREREEPEEGGQCVDPKVKSEPVSSNAREEVSAENEIMWEGDWESLTSYAASKQISEQEFKAELRVGKLQREGYQKFLYRVRSDSSLASIITRENSSDPKSRESIEPRVWNDVKGNFNPKKFKSGCLAVLSTITLRPGISFVSF